ncbi:MAG: thioether cross-link-forming SCIFF peptide maturase [Thermoanaerobacteraceae bacterium]|nr:thioether cross-link-forming SCIFF peptide maturase [Thermoanaerobacteraceae bacterium]
MHAIKELSPSDVHLFSYRELNILLDVNSGAVHVLDDVAAEYLRCLLNGESPEPLATRYGWQAVKEAGDQLAGLQQQGLLGSKSTIDVGALEQEQSYIKSLCLHVSHDCNLRCRYCFAGTGRFGGERQLMDLATAKQAVDFLLDASGPRQFCEIDFFGGEPLLNFSVVRDTVLYAKEAARKTGKEIRLTLTTNGMLLDEAVRKFIKDHGIKVVLSLDGRPEINDYMRPAANGEGSYGKILPNFHSMVRDLNGVDYYIRGTYTRHNLDFSEDIVHMLRQGFRELSVEPVVAPPEAPYSLSEQDYPRIAQEYDRLVELYLEWQAQGKSFNFFHFNVNLEQGPCLSKRLRGCGAGFEYLAVTPGGDLYPCHQFVGEEEFCLGNVGTGITNWDLSSYFQRAHVFNKKDCPQCWARFHCSGGCNANAYQQNGDLFTPYGVGCLIQKKRLECAIYLEVKKLLQE